MQEVFEKIMERLEEKALEHAINGQQYNSDGYFTQATDEYGKRDGLYDAQKTVQEVVAEHNNGWIPCSERLPEPVRPVLVTLRNWMNDRYFVRVGRFHTDHWNTDEGIVENSVVIAWQPLPEHYQPKGE